MLVPFFLGGGYGVAYILIEGVTQMQKVADRGGRGSKKAKKLRTYLMDAPIWHDLVESHYSSVAKIKSTHRSSGKIEIAKRVI